MTAVNLSFKTIWPKSEDNDNSCGDKNGVSNCEFLTPVILDVDPSQVSAPVTWALSECSAPRSNLSRHLPRVKHESRPGLLLSHLFAIRVYHPPWLSLVQAMKYPGSQPSVFSVAPPLPLNQGESEGRRNWLLHKNHDWSKILNTCNSISLANKGSDAFTLQLSLLRKVKLCTQLFPILFVALMVFPSFYFSLLWTLHRSTLTLNTWA